MSADLKRVALFIGIFAVFALLETFFPRRTRSFPRSSRWPVNLGFGLANPIVLRLVFGISAVGFAEWIESQGIGVFRWLGLSGAQNVVITLLLLDLLIWTQHWTFHRVPCLWALHRVHHADPDLDASSGIRFHPFEAVLSMGLKFGAIVALGASPFGVLLFEVLLNGFAVFNHANLRMPLALDRWLRFWIVTPDMHRIHHSIRREEMNRCFGFNLSIWDRLFGTYADKPQGGQEAFAIGLEDVRGEDAIRLRPAMTLFKYLK